MNAKKCLFTLTAAVLVSAGVFAQSTAKYGGKFDVRVSQNYLDGHYGLMNFLHAGIGYRITEGAMLSAECGRGISSLKNYHGTTLASLGITAVAHPDKSFQLETTLSGGMMWDKLAGGGQGTKAFASVIVTPKFYVNRHNYFGIRSEAILSKDYLQASLLGLTLGLSF